MSIYSTTRSKLFAKNLLTTKSSSTGLTDDAHVLSSNVVELLQYQAENGIGSMNLFQLGDFTLHSGGKSNFKIDCDCLSDTEIEVVASLLAERLPPFRSVTGIPQGGLRLATAMQKHCYPSDWFVDLLVDDVWTTGGSMEKARLDMGGLHPVRGAVIFARRPVAAWVTPLFQMYAGFRGEM